MWVEKQTKLLPIEFIGTSHNSVAFLNAIRVPINSTQRLFLTNVPNLMSHKVTFSIYVAT